MRPVTIVYFSLLFFFQAKGLEPHQEEQAFLLIHSHLHSLMGVAQHRSRYLVVFLGEQCLLSILEDNLLTLVRYFSFLSFKLSLLKKGTTPFLVLEISLKQGRRSIRDT